jgi:competence protein ComEC
MKSNFRARPAASLLLLALLLPLNAAAYFYVLHPPARLLEVTFLDVGQGDAILIEGPTGIQMLIDGGRDRSVLRALPKAMGPFDRTLDLVVETHPDADHIGGLADVFARYRVRHFLTPGIAKETSQVQRLAAKLENEKGVTRILARRGERLHLGGGAYADVLYPDHDVSTAEANAGSVVLRIVYGKTAFMLTGDLPAAGEEYVVRMSGSGSLRSDVLKAGHHGSRTSNGERLLAAVAPATVVISAGKENAYGHPHTETLERIRTVGAAAASTAEDGSIAFISDGVQVTRK